MSESKTPDFESVKQINPYGQEYWSARDLAPLLVGQSANNLAKKGEKR